MDPTDDPELPHIGARLDPLRAAIDVVAEGQATRVTVHVYNARSLLPAAAHLARRAGVRAELVEPTDPESELTILPIAAAGR